VGARCMSCLLTHADFVWCRILLGAFCEALTCAISAFATQSAFMSMNQRWDGCDNSSLPDDLLRLSQVEIGS
jgi:hypothetical protein